MAVFLQLWTVGNTLRVLFSALLLSLTAALGVPLFLATQEEAASEAVIRDARVGRVVFTALQNVRLNRSPTRTSLEAKDPAPQAFLDNSARLRAKAEPALSFVVDECEKIECAADRGISSGLRNSIDRLAAISREADAALRAPLADRRPGIAQDFFKASTDVVDRLEKISSFLGEKLRMTNPHIAELVAIKTLSYVARDGVGLERAVLDDGLNAKSLTAAQQRRADELRARAEVTWPLVRELVAREGISAEVAAAVKRASAEAFVTYEKTRKSVYDALVKGEPSPVSRGELLKASNAALDALIAVPHAALEEAERVAAAYGDAAGQKLMVLRILFIVSTVLGALSFLTIQNRITRPVTAITDAMHRLVAGESEVDIPGAERADELGAMARAVQIFKTNMTEAARLRALQENTKLELQRERQAATLAMADRFERSVGSIATAVAAAAYRLSHSAHEMVATVEDAGRSAAVVSAAAADANKNVDHVVQASEELSASTGSIGAQVTESVRITREAAEQASVTNTTVERLNEAGQRIGEVIGLIQNVAAQTNLLALNATIEAARAGAAGKGFAVVASEVKHLAGQTAAATEEVGKHVAEIRRTTDEAVDAIRGIAGTMTRINDVAAEINAAVSLQQSATGEISKSVVEAAELTRSVSDNISAVSKSSLELSATANGVLASAEELTKQSGRLNDEVKAFLAAVRAA